MLDSQDFWITHLGLNHYSSTRFSVVNITFPSILIGQVKHPQIPDDISTSDCKEVECFAPASPTKPLPGSSLSLSLIQESGQRASEDTSHCLTLSSSASSFG